MFYPRINFRGSREFYIECRSRKEINGIAWLKLGVCKFKVTKRGMSKESFASYLGLKVSNNAEMF
jgi:hypothetical protein